MESALDYGDLEAWVIALGGMDPHVKAAIISKQVRANIGLSQERMAEYMMVGHHSYQRWEWSKSTPEFFSTLLLFQMDMLGALRLVQKGSSVSIPTNTLLGDFLFASGFFTPKQALTLIDGLLEVARQRVEMAEEKVTASGVK